MLPFPGSARHSFSYKKIFNDIKEDLTGAEKNLDKVKAQTLIIWGDKDRVLDIAAAKAFSTGILSSERAIFKNSGHVPQVEKPRKTAVVYTDFRVTEHQ